MADMSIESDGIDGKVTFSAGNASITVNAVWDRQSEETQLQFALSGHGCEIGTGRWDGDRLRWIMQPPTKPQ